MFISEKLMVKRTGRLRKLSFKKKSTGGGRDTEVIHADHSRQEVQFSHNCTYTVFNVLLLEQPLVLSII